MFDMLSRVQKVFTAARVRAFVGEFVGTALFVMVIVMASLRVENANTGSLQPGNPFLYTFSAFAFGLMLALMIYVFRVVASAHFNPAITIAMFTLGKVSIKRALLNLLAQFLGAILAVLLVRLTFASQLFSSPSPASSLASIEALGLTTNTLVILEALATFIFAMVVIAVTQAKQLTNVAPLIIGTALALCILIVQEYTSGILNPALALATGMPVIYFFAPILGGILAAVLTYSLHNQIVMPLRLANQSKKKNESARKSK